MYFLLCYVPVVMELLPGIFILLTDATTVVKVLAIFGLHGLQLLGLVLYEIFYGIVPSTRRIFSAPKNRTLPSPTNGSAQARTEDSILLVASGPSDPSHARQLEPNCPPDSRESLADVDRGCYVYTPLLDTDIRLIRVNPSTTASDPLQLELIHLRLLTARARSYTALSYTWGAGTYTTAVSLNGRNLRIRSNLEQILRRLGSLDCGWIWVDAICINQADLKECSAQVLRMCGIYAGASSVLASLDITSEDTERIVQLATLVNPELSQDGQTEEMYRLIEDPTSLLAIQHFCGQSYWDRIWIIQEFAIGHSIDFLLCDSIVGLKAINAVLALFAPDPYSLRYNSSIFDIRRSWQIKSYMFLLDILVGTRGSLCIKRHDRVFGLLGLVSDGLDLLSEPNYEADLNDLSLSMTRAYIERRSIDIVLLAPHPKETSGLPSWSPDWFRFDESPPDRRIYDQLVDLRDQNVSAASPKRWYATGNTSAGVEFLNYTLRTSARSLGTICSLGWALSDPEGHDFPMSNERWARRCKKVDITKVMYQAILKSQYAYNRPTPPRYKRLAFPEQVLETYCWTYIFLAKHGRCDSENPWSDLARWACANRTFFAGGRRLQDHAKRLCHPVLHCGIALWNDLTVNSRTLDLFQDLKNMASKNMRLMCLDDDSFGIGWAVRSARLQDEAFLIPGCSVPVILRQCEGERRYKVVGDAIVLGVMKGEIWGRTRQADLVDIQII
ncbi:HET-domain-containing protein [Glonium stellatum]|uniref:HET-domain-containing protein n=1 Tax=Glonium stellatum TaxID=574774 RepID=A0A8E2JWL3_9PEZI|nr:HET-domain-containing protein [Glonium stellatum]